MVVAQVEEVDTVPALSPPKTRVYRMLRPTEMEERTVADLDRLPAAKLSFHPVVTPADAVALALILRRWVWMAMRPHLLNGYGGVTSRFGVPGLKDGFNIAGFGSGSRNNNNNDNDNNKSKKTRTRTRRNFYTYTGLCPSF
jgi:hypothetical protein